MKIAISLSCVLVAALLVGSQGEPIGRTVTNLMQGGQTMVNMVMVSGARAIAPLVDTFVQMTQRFMNVGKRYMQHLDAMLSHMDMDPQMQVMAEAMHMNLYDIETAVDALMQNTVWGGEVVKATADCVVPQFESVTKVKDDSFRALGTILQDHKNAILQLASAGDTIEQQMASLQDHEEKIAMMVANGQGLEAMQYVIKNRQKTEKDGRAMEQVYFGALDEYREATGAALKKMSDTLGKIHEDGEKIMTKLDNCIEPKIMKMIKSEIQQKKNKTGPKHLLPESLSFANHNHRGSHGHHIQTIPFTPTEYRRPQYGPAPEPTSASVNEQQNGPTSPGTTTKSAAPAKEE